MSFEVRRIRPDEAAVLRTIRLAALADTPSAFAADLATERAMSDEQWQERVDQSIAGECVVTFLAVEGDATIGLVTGLLSEGSAGTAEAATVELVSMWTAPSARRRGVGRALVEAVIEWTEGRASAVELWVVTGNDRAESLYRGSGFEPVGDHVPLPSDPCRLEQRMRRVLRPQP